MNWIPTVIQGSFNLPYEPFCLNPQEHRIARGLTLGLFEGQLWLVDKNEVAALEELVTLYDADIYEGITIKRDKFLLPVLRPIGVSGDRWSSSFEEAVSNEIGDWSLMCEDEENACYIQLWGFPTPEFNPVWDRKNGILPLIEDALDGRRLTREIVRPVEPPAGRARQN